MEHKIYNTDSGNIHYYLSNIDQNKPTLILLPGLTANHHLFDPQIEYFKDTYNLLVWDPPGHSKSRPFDLNFTLSDKAKWLNEIIKKEDLNKLILIGQSMGGYVAQVYQSLFPEEVLGLISIDSSSLDRNFYSRVEIKLLKRMEPIYRLFPWKLLKRLGPKNCAETPYGQDLMLKMMEEYDNDKELYYKLSGFGYKILAEALEENSVDEINCPVLLICGERDKAGSVKYYNKKWNRQKGYPIKWIKGAGHNSNTDQPELVNLNIELFIKKELEPKLKKRN